MSEIQLNGPQTLYRRWEDSQWSPFESTCRPTGSSGRRWTRPSGRSSTSPAVVGPPRSDVLVGPRALAVARLAAAPLTLPPLLAAGAVPRGLHLYVAAVGLAAHDRPFPPLQRPGLRCLQFAADTQREDEDEEWAGQGQDPEEPHLSLVGEADVHEQAVGRPRHEDHEDPGEEARPQRRAPGRVARVIQQVVAG